MRTRRHRFSLIEALVYTSIFGLFAGMVGQLFYQTSLTQRHHLAAAWSNHQSHQIRSLWQQHVHAGDATAQMDDRDLIIRSTAGSHRIQLPEDARATTHLASQDGQPIAVLELQFTIPHFHQTQQRHYRFVAAAPHTEEPHAP